MSEENRELIERMLSRARLEPHVLWEMLDDEVHWDIAGVIPVPDFNEPLVGPAAVQEFFRTWAGAFDDWNYEATEVVDAGPSVVAQIRQWGRGKGSGAEVENVFWQVWTLRDGKVVWVSHHADKADALTVAAARD